MRWPSGYLRWIVLLGSALIPFESRGAPQVADLIWLDSFEDAGQCVDLDQDGWSICQGDCCDTQGQCGPDSGLVNPGAFDFTGNGLDDDCDGAADNAIVSCDQTLPSNSSQPLEYARAMDLCSTTVESPPILQRTWGVISGEFRLADATGTPASNARSIRPGFGSSVPPEGGTRFAVLSTGIAAAQTAPSNTNPAWASAQGGVSLGTISPRPADWLAANGGSAPTAPGCPAPQGQNAVDPILLKLRVRVPTNARSFSARVFFYSSEYPEFVCSPFDDYFLALLDSQFVPVGGEIANPADKNLAFHDPPPAGPPFYPISVNLATGSTGLFTQCKNGLTGCATSAVPGAMNACTGVAQLTGTGFDIVNPPPQDAGQPGFCGANNLLGGGTGWLTLRGNVVRGETIELRFVIWDTSDAFYDSVVLIDDFRWSASTTTPGTGQ